MQQTAGDSGQTDFCAEAGSAQQNAAKSQQLECLPIQNDRQVL